MAAQVGLLVEEEKRKLALGLLPLLWSGSEQTVGAHNT